MLGSIALSALLALAIALFGLIQRRRRAGQSWHLLRDLSPVSSQWLADYRRGS
jgi:hypothetical protein